MEEQGNTTQTQDIGLTSKLKSHETVIHFKVDGEPYETDENKLTPNEILQEFANKSPATNYLVGIDGHHRISYEGKGDIPIKLHNKMKFQVICIGPTPVSDGSHENRY